MRRRARNKPSRDPSTIANPHARPRAGSLAPMARALPPIVDHRSAGPRVRFALQRGEPLAWDNIAAWSLWYRTEYADGHVDEVCRVQAVIAATEGKALDTLQRLQYGVATRLHLFAVDPPNRPQDLAALRALRGEEP